MRLTKTSFSFKEKSLIVIVIFVVQNSINTILSSDYLYIYYMKTHLNYNKELRNSWITKILTILRHWHFVFTAHKLLSIKKYPSIRQALPNHYSLLTALPSHHRPKLTPKAHNRVAIHNHARVLTVFTKSTYSNFSRSAKSCSRADAFLFCLRCSRSMKFIFTPFTMLSIRIG